MSEGRLEKRGWVREIGEVGVRIGWARVDREDRDEGQDMRDGAVERVD